MKELVRAQQRCEYKFHLGFGYSLPLALVLLIVSF
jgi:hypothetical protein